MDPGKWPLSPSPSLSPRNLTSLCPSLCPPPQAGHPFQLHCAHSAFSHAHPKHEAPTFLLFLDCVWQLGRQFLLSLEFGEGLLLALFEHAYASPFGTFLCNSNKER